eukprot:TRINITY_DN5135_c0_g1_i2.p1 TRINITY_DN5135_c0_g1~~TRINITY_DN5135_c0_g1_i2.p1  ORF type:complete len:116 (+),score=1.68 TRINITY_DN5135_c0_g1_i2:87-434(+)
MEDLREHVAQQHHFHNNMDLPPRWYWFSFACCMAARPLNNVAIAPCKFRFEMGFLLRGFQLLTRARGVSTRPFQDIELLEMRIGGSSRTEPNCSYETLFSTGRLKRRPSTSTTVG